MSAGAEGRWLRDLEAQSAERRAAAALGRLGVRGAIPQLYETLDDGESLVRAVAAAALVRAGWKSDWPEAQSLVVIAQQDWVAAIAEGPAAAGPLADVLAGADPLVRRELQEALVKIGESAATMLCARLGAGPDAAHADVVAALRRLPPDEVVPLLLKMHSRDEAAGGRRAASEVVRGLGDGALLSLCAALGSPVPALAAAAADLLGELGDPRAVPALCPALDHPEAVVRRTVVQALGEVADPQGERPLHALIADVTAQERVAETGAAGGSWDTGVRGPIAAACRSDTAVQTAAAGTFTDVRGPGAEVVALLVGRLSDSDGDVRRLAADALGRLGWQPETPAEEVALAISRCEWSSMAGFGPLAVQPLCACLTDTAWEVRRAVAALLGELRDPSAVEPLCARLGDTDADVRLAAAEALVRIGPPGVERICRHFGQVRGAARQTAARVLGWLGDRRAVETLCTFLHDPDPGVRSAVVNALGSLPARSALPALRKRLRHWGPRETDPLLRIALSNAIRSIEQATAHLRAVPIPSAAPVPDGKVLPIPSEDPTVDRMRRRSGLRDDDPGGQKGPA